MAHIEQRTFFNIVAENWRKIPNHTSHRILEIGSYDVNGTVRQEFREAALYTGVDLIAGPGVDVVSRGHELSSDLGQFDITIATEVFEHDKEWPLTLGKMFELTRPGGAVIVSCASTGRPEHGTERANSSLSPGTTSIGDDYYSNVSEKAFSSALENLGFDFFDLRFFRWPADLYFVGLRSSSANENSKSHPLRGLIPRDDDWQRIEGIMPLLDKVVRLPLALIGTDERSEKRANDIAFVYWKSVSRVATLFGVEERGRVD